MSYITSLVKSRLIRSILLLCITGGGTLGILYLNSDELGHSKSDLKSQAHSHKLQILKPHQHKKNHTEKLSGPLKVELERNDFDKYSGYDESQFILKIESEVKLNNLKVEWLPMTKMELISGIMVDQFSVEPFKEHFVVIRFRHVNDLDHRIKVRVTSLDPSFPFAVSVHHLSNPPQNDFTTKDEILNSDESNAETDQSQKVFQ